MKKILTPFLLCIFLWSGNLSAFADTVWADDSINEVIIKQYDANALKDEMLPKLPDRLKNEKNSSSIPTVDSSSYNQQPKTEKPIVSNQNKVIKPSQAYTQPQGESKDFVWVKKGTKFSLRIEQPIDDSIPIGSKIYFTSLYPEVNKYITIPAGTKFIGTIEDSHLPQISGNGGLIVINIDSFIYKGRTYPIESKVIMIGQKRIFQNNIKGKRTYWKSVAKSIKPGKRFYGKSWTITKKFAGDGLEVILTPITFASGVTVVAANTVASPFIALFSKGGRLFVNKGTRFKIKLMRDTAVYL